MTAILYGMDDYLKALCFEPVLRPVCVKNLVEEIVAALPNTDAFKLDLRLNQDQIDVNPGMFDLVLRNLLDNAVKHHSGPGGALVVSLDEDETAWLIGIEDDGPGMPRQQAAFLNGRGEDRAWDEIASGGLGLRIVKCAIEGVGGSVHATSNTCRHRGTKVLIRWPKDLTTAE
jgi:signal transduction histidine kinase